jgi:hypothetical protein
MLDHAIRLAERGFRIFPLRPAGKIPPEGFLWLDRATSDVAQVKAWWSGRYAEHNIGVACGQGLLVLDFDTKGKPGLASLEELELMWGEITMKVRTPSGGVHLYGAADTANIPNSIDSIPGYPGVDVRSDGGYVVGPGSIVGGVAYVEE